MRKGFRLGLPAAAFLAVWCGVTVIWIWTELESLELTWVQPDHGTQVELCKRVVWFHRFRSTSSDRLYGSDATSSFIRQPAPSAKLDPPVEGRFWGFGYHRWKSSAARGWDFSLPLWGCWTIAAMAPLCWVGKQLWRHRAN